MSLYVSNVGIVKIKPEYVEQFGYIFRGEYDREKVQDDVFSSLFNAIYDDEYYEFGIREIQNWSHWDEKEEWVGKYSTSYEDGIFTYGLHYRTLTIIMLYLQQYIAKKYFYRKILNNLCHI